MTDKQYLTKAFDEAFSGVKNNTGGPFGAIIVLENKIIGKGSNMVTSLNDPTAHAEIIAIRAACKKVKNFHLEGAKLYSTCEPCPMCLSAIYWAKINEVIYSSTRFDAEKIGFGDNFIYDELSKPIDKRILKLTRIEIPESSTLFDEWINKEDKINY